MLFRNICLSWRPSLIFYSSSLQRLFTGIFCLIKEFICIYGSAYKYYFEYFRPLGEKNVYLKSESCRSCTPYTSRTNTRTNTGTSPSTDGARRGTARERVRRRNPATSYLAKSRTASETWDCCVHLHVKGDRTSRLFKRTTIARFSLYQSCMIFHLFSPGQKASPGSHRFYPVAEAHFSNPTRHGVIFCNHRPAVM